MSPTRQSEETRQKILGTALGLFHSGSFKATSVNQIVDEAGVTKGALFHHFKGKNELGYAVVDELLREDIRRTWGEPLAESDDPISTITQIMEGMREQLRQNPEMLRCGCPVNNLSQEMSAVDEDFRRRLESVYQVWLKSLEGAFERGIAAGKVKSGTDPFAISTMVVALFEGAAGLIKVHRGEAFIESMRTGMLALFAGLRP